MHLVRPLKSKGVSIALAAVFVLIAIYLSLQLYAAHKPLVALQTGQWTYASPDIDLELTGYLRDSIWSKFVSLEKLAVEHHQGFYRVGSASVWRTFDGEEGYIGDIPAPQGVKGFRIVRTPKQRTSTFKMNALLDPNETYSKADHRNGPIKVKLSYRFLGMKHTVVQSIDMMLDPREVAFDSLRATEQEMITDWRLATLAEGKPRAWLEKNSYKVTFPLHNDTVFDHMAVFVDKTLGRWWGDTGIGAPMPWMFLEGERRVRDGAELFDLQLHISKQEFKASEPIDVSATLEYTGNSRDMVVWHGIPHVHFYVLRNDNEKPSYSVATSLGYTVYERGKAYRYDYRGIRSDRPPLTLPEGEYTIGVLCTFTLTPVEGNDNYTPPRKEIKIKVTP